MVCLLTVLYNVDKCSRGKVFMGLVPKVQSAQARPPSERKRSIRPIQPILSAIYERGAKMKASRARSLAVIIGLNSVLWGAIILLTHSI